MRDGVLIQEEYAGDHPGTAESAWRVIVATMLCQQTSGRQVRPALDVLLERWPTPQLLSFAGDELEEVLRPTGFYKQRARRLRDVSNSFSRWIQDSSSPYSLPTAEWVEDQPGCGEYTVEAYKFVVLGDRSFRPKDKELRKAWNRDRGLLQPGLGSRP